MIHKTCIIDKKAKISKNVKVLSTLEDGTIVAIQENKIMGTSFHPEITGSSKVHEYFINLTKL